MAKTFLRSGSLDAVLPLGENGQPVYLSALQLRETLRLRKQQPVADCLAIPQPNDAGNRLDWYSPVSGKVTSWAAATDSAREHALNQLVACQQAVADMCEKAQRSDKTSQKLFGALLAKAIQFPDQNFVYLVGGKPVLTFWGFVSLEKRSQQDALDCLRATKDDAPPLNLSKLAAPAAAAVTPVVAPAPAAAEPAPAPVAEPEPVSAAKPQPEAVTVITPPEAETKTAAAPSVLKKSLIRYGWMLPAAALLVAFGVQLSNSGGKNDTPKPQAAPENTAPVVKTTEPAPVSTPAPQINAPEPEQHTMPVAPATVDATIAPAPVAAPAATDIPAPAAPVLPVLKDDLVLPADAIKMGSTKFLNGNWRVIVDMKRPITGKPPSLRYQMKNGKGIAKIVQGDGISCRVEVFAGVMKSGNLVINSRTKARCSDGSRYKMPDLVCSQGLSGPAECNGQYNADTVLPMMMKREGK